MAVVTLPGVQELHRSAIDLFPDGVYLIDQDKTVRIWNAAAEKLTGYVAAEMIGERGVFERLDALQFSGEPLCNAQCPILCTMHDGRQRITEALLRHRDGHRVPVRLQTIPIKDADNITAVMAVFTEVRGASFYCIRAQAFADPLTGLPDRRYIETVLEESMNDLCRHSRTFGVLFVDIDNIAWVNQEYGDSVGDRLLCQVANELDKRLCKTDLIGRWDGDDFVCILMTDSLQELKRVAEKLRLVIQATKVEVNQEQVGFTASIGVTMAEPEDTVKGLIERAAALMHISRISGTNCCTAG